MKYINYSELEKTYEEYDNGVYDYIIIHQQSKEIEDKINIRYKILDRDEHFHRYEEYPYRTDQLLIFDSLEGLTFEYPVESYECLSTFDIVIIG